MPMPPRSRRRRSQRAANSVRAVKGGYSGQYCRRAGADQRPPLYRRQSARRASASNPRSSCWRKSNAYARDQDARVRQVSASLAATWQMIEIVRAGRRDLSRRAPDGAGQRVGRRRRRRPPGDRQPRLRRPRESYERFVAAKAWRGAVDEALRQALVNLDAVPAPAGEMDVVLGPGWPGVLLHEAVGHGLEGDFNRKKTSAFAGLMGQQRGRQGRDRGRRRHHGVAPRLALHRRRRHAHQPHRADRGRRAGRLHAGPPERAADGHAPDRQRPPRKLRATSRCRA